MPAGHAASGDRTSGRDRGRVSVGSVVGGRYLLEARIGEGGMGTVFRARDVASGDVFAIKILKDSADELGDRFLREARITASLAHANMVEIHEVIESEGAPVIVMELLYGESLRARLARGGRMTIEELAPIALSVIDAVRAAHEAGVVHRDLKPDNVFLCPSASGVDAKVLDFGIAKVTKDAAAPPVTAAPLTRTGQILGTPQYMAPEQIFGEKDIDARADVWALGVIFYEALSGSRPFDGENAGQIFKAIALEAPAPLATKVSWLDPEICEMVHRMLGHSRAERLADLGEVERILSRFAGRPPLDEALAPTPASAPPPRRRRTFLAVAAIAASAVLAFAASVSLGRSSAETLAVAGADSAATVISRAAPSASADATSQVPTPSPPPVASQRPSLEVPSKRAAPVAASPPVPLLASRSSARPDPSPASAPIPSAAPAPIASAPSATPHRSGTLRRDEF